MALPEGFRQRLGNLSESAPTVGLLGVDPDIARRVMGIVPDAEVVRLTVSRAASLHFGGMAVVITTPAMAVDAGLADGQGGTDRPALVVVGGEPEDWPDAQVVDGHPDSPSLQWAVDTALDVGPSRRLLRSILVEQDDQHVAERVAFGARTLAALFTLAWLVMFSHPLGGWLIGLVAVWIVARTLWWRLAGPLVLVDVAVVAMLGSALGLVYESVPISAVVLPMVVWMQAGHRFGFVRGFSLLMALAVLVSGGVLVSLDSPSFNVERVVIPVILAVLGIATGAMGARLLAPSDPRDRQFRLDQLRMSLYELSERQAATAAPLDLGTAAQNVLDRLVRDATPAAAVVLVTDGVAPLAVAAAHNLVQPPPARLAWTPSLTRPEHDPGGEAAGDATGDRRDEHQPGGGDLPEGVAAVVSSLDRSLPRGQRVVAPTIVEGEVLGALVLVDPGPQFAAEGLHEHAEEAALTFDGVRLFNRLRMHALDQERARIGRSLHDSVMQTLSHVGMQLDMAVRDGAVVADAATLQALRQHVVASLGEMRQIVNDLRSAKLDRGLGPALEALGETMAPAGGPTITVEAQRVDGLDPETEEQLLRIAQEAVSNSLRHARAREIRVKLEPHEEWVALQVADDGVGFAGPASSEPGGGVGMSSIRQRASAIGARVDIDPGPGAMITVLVPLRSSTSASKHADTTTDRGGQTAHGRSNGRPPTSTRSDHDTATR